MRKLFITILSVCVALMVTFNADAAWGGTKSPKQIANEAFDDDTDSFNTQMTAPVTVTLPPGAATSANQVSAIAILTTIDAAVSVAATEATLAAMSAAQATAANQASAIALLSTMDATLTSISSAVATAANQVSANALLTTMDTALAQIEIAIEGTGTGAQEIQGSYTAGLIFPTYGKGYVIGGINPTSSNAFFPLNVQTSGVITLGQNQAVGGQDGINHAAQYTFGDNNSVGVRPSYGLMFNGTNWDRIRGSLTYGMVVDARNTTGGARAMMYTGSAWTEFLGDSNGQKVQGTYAPGDSIMTKGRFFGMLGQNTAGQMELPKMSNNGIWVWGQNQAAGGSDNISGVPALLPYSDNDATGIQQVYNLFWDGAAWDRFRGSAEYGQVVDARNTTGGARQVGTWDINDISGTVSLPTGAATSANQVSAIAILTTIDAAVSVAATEATLAAMSAAQATAANQTAANALLTTMDASLTQIDADQSTAANQATGNSSLSSIDGKQTDIESNTDTGTGIDHKAVTVGNTASLILAADPTRRSVVIVNAYTDLVAIGNVDVTINSAAATDGLVLAESGKADDGTGGSVTLDTTAAIYGIGESASSKVTILWETD